jgi:mRNA interferase MazF
MGKFVKGEIVVVPFPFSNLSASKRRPALVLVDLPGDDLILCQITSQTVKDNMAILIDVTDVYNGTLNAQSNVRSNAWTNWKSGQLFTYFHDWYIEHCTEYVFDCNSSGIPHRHAANRLFARNTMEK